MRPVGDYPTGPKPVKLIILETEQITTLHTGCRHGKSTDDFDNHVFACWKERGVPHTEPYFKIWIFMVLNDYQKLLKYERDLHLAGHDTMNG